MFGGIGSEGEADDLGCFFAGLAHGEEDVGGEDGSDHAGGAGGGGDAFEVEAHEHVFGGDVGETDVGGVRDALGVESIDLATGPDAREGVLEFVAQLLDALCVGVEFFEGVFGGMSHGGDGSGVFGAGAATVLLSASVEAGCEWDPVFEVEKSDAFWALEFVSGSGGGVDGAEIDWQFADGLDGVGVAEDVFLATGLGDFGDGLDDAGFVIGGHEGDEDGVWADGFCDGFCVDGAVLIWGDEGDLEPLFLEVFCGGEDGVVFDGGADDVVTEVAMGLCEADDGEVIGFGS